MEKEQGIFPNPPVSNIEMIVEYHNPDNRSQNIP
jgi:hypothetical protein